MRKTINIDCNYRSPQDVVKQGVVEVATRELYDLDGGRTLKKNGALDARMVQPSAPMTIVNLLTGLGDVFKIGCLRNVRRRFTEL
jgi:hypothetical protein